MKTLEIIQLRAVGQPLDVLCNQIKESIVDPGVEADIVRIYRQEGLVTDLAIHIHHDSGSTEAGTSEFALRLASELGAFGLVKHTVWREIR